MIKNKFEIKFFALILLASISIALGLYSMANFSKENSFLLQEVSIKNVNFFSEDDIRKITNTYMGETLEKIDLEEIQNNILNIGWVKNIFIRKSFPQKIEIKIEEKIPLASWKRDGNIFLVEKNGNIINYISTIDKNDFILVKNDFILVKNEIPPSNLEEIFILLNQNHYMKSRINAVENVSYRRWNLYIDSFGNNIKIMLPEMDILNTLIKLETMDKEKDLLKRNFNIIDARNDEWLIR